MAQPKKVTPQVPGQPATESGTVTNTETASETVETVIAEEQEKPEVTEPEQPPIVAPKAAKSASKQSIRPVLTDRGYIVKG